MSTWIPVGKKMPDDEINVLVYSEAEDPDVWIGYHDGDDGWRSIEGVLMTVTHWMDLPDPPEAKR